MILPSNRIAFLRMAEVAQGRRSFLVVLGPTGWGKTELLKAAADLSDDEAAGSPIHVTALDFLARPMMHLRRGAVMLDDVRLVERRPRERARLRGLVESRRQRGLPTLICLDCRREDGLLRELSRTAAPQDVVTISPPSVSERERLVRHQAARLGLDLDPSLADSLACRLGGNGSTMTAALKRLRLISSDWRSSDRILRAFGILFPCLNESAEWDLRDLAGEAVRRSAPGAGTESRDAWTAWLLLMEIGLGEDPVSRYLHTPPGTAHRQAMACSLEPDHEEMSRTVRETFLGLALVI
ncbi:MAG: hypothetical protein MH204_03800 [Fimbriimonadaceae bacterium]|nr:hypothetical protein [Fimbriimonadaceae bacterium]